VSARIVRVIALPYDSGRRSLGMGRGPELLIGDASVAEEADAAGIALEHETIDGIDEELPEIRRVMELDRELAARVAAARAEGRFPLVLAGNCNSSLGTVSGAGPEGIGVVWLDAHADFDTPEDNTSGFFDVMALSMLTGGSWPALCATIDGFKAVPEGHVILAAVRDLEPYQRRAVESSELRVVPGALDDQGFDAELEGLRERTEALYLHLDLDSLDASDGRANRYAADGGPPWRRLEWVVERVFETGPVRAAALTAYDPSADADGGALAVARRLIAAVLRGAAAQSGSTV
jgi:arginase